MVAACGNGEKKATETTAAPTNETNTTATVTTTTTAQSSSDVKEISLADTQRIGNADTGYLNIPKDWTKNRNRKYNMFHQINIMLWHYTISLKISRTWKR